MCPLSLELTQFDQVNYAVNTTLATNPGPLQCERKHTTFFNCHVCRSWVFHQLFQRKNPDVSHIMWLYHYKLAILILTLLHHIWCSCLLVIEKDDGRSRPFLTIHFHYMDRNFPAYFLGPHFIGVVVRGQNIQYLQCFYHNRGVPAPWSVTNQMSYTMPAGCWVLTKNLVSNTFYLPSVRAGIKEVS